MANKSKKVLKAIAKLFIAPILISIFMCIVIGNDFSNFGVAIFVVFFAYYIVLGLRKISKSSEASSNDKHTNYSPSIDTSNIKSNEKNSLKNSSEKNSLDDDFHTAYMLGFFDDDDE